MGIEVRHQLPANVDTATGRLDCETAIRRDLMDHFMRDARSSRLIVGRVATFGLVAMCWNHADRTLLLGWLTLSLGIFALLLALEAPYYYGRKTLDTAEDQQRMIGMLAPFYVGSGVTWGMPLLFFMADSVPGTVQTACGVVIAVMGLGPSTSMALIPKLMRCFMHAFFCTVIACLLYRTVAQHGYAFTAPYILMAIPCILWVLMIRASNAIFRSNQKMYTLQHQLANKVEEARQAIETKNRLLAAATHDIRQPVAALSLFASHLVEFPDLHRELAPKIAMATNAIRNLFDSLFEYSALESDAVSVTLQEVDLGALLAGMHAQFETVARAKRIDLRVRHLHAMVQTDPVGLRRIIGNLLANAIRYSTPNTRILLAARMHQGDLCVQVWDQGIGIEPSEIDNIFREFYRINVQSAAPEIRDAADIEGLGLGLSVVARLSQLLHIRIEVKSTVNRGTRFTLRLPNAARVQG